MKNWVIDDNKQGKWLRCLFNYINFLFVKCDWINLLVTHNGYKIHSLKCDPTFCIIEPKGLIFLRENIYK